MPKSIAFDQAAAAAKSFAKAKAKSKAKAFAKAKAKAKAMGKSQPEKEPKDKVKVQCPGTGVEKESQREKQGEKKKEKEKQEATDKPPSASPTAKAKAQGTAAAKAPPETKDDSQKKRKASSSLAITDKVDVEAEDPKADSNATSRMIMWLSYRADPQKNKKKVQLAESQKALQESIFMCCVLFLIWCFFVLHKTAQHNFDQDYSSLTTAEQRVNFRNNFDKNKNGKQVDLSWTGGFMESIQQVTSKMAHHTEDFFNGCFWDNINHGCGLIVFANPKQKPAKQKNTNKQNNTKQHLHWRNQILEMNSFNPSDFKDDPVAKLSKIQNLIMMSEEEFGYKSVTKVHNTDPDLTRYYYIKSDGEKTEKGTLELETLSINRGELRGKMLQDALANARDPTIKVENPAWLKLKPSILVMASGKGKLLGDMNCGQELLCKMVLANLKEEVMDEAKKSLKTMEDYMTTLRQFCIMLEPKDASIDEAEANGYLSQVEDHIKKITVFRNLFKGAEQKYKEMLGAKKQETMTVS